MDVIRSELQQKDCEAETRDLSVEQSWLLVKEKMLLLERGYVYTVGSYTVSGVIVDPKIIGSSYYFLYYFIYHVFHIIEIS